MRRAAYEGGSRYSIHYSTRRMGGTRGIVKQHIGDTPTAPAVMGAPEGSNIAGRSRPMWVRASLWFTLAGCRARLCRLHRMMGAHSATFGPNDPRRSQPPRGAGWITN